MEPKLPFVPNEDAASLEIRRVNHHREFVCWCVRMVTGDVPEIDPEIVRKHAEEEWVNANP